MSEDGGSRSELQVVYNVDRILDCHTYLTGRESAEQILEYRGACGVDQRQHPRQYRESYLQPQLGLFETATTLGHIVQEVSPTREEYRNMIFYENAYSQRQSAIKEPPNPRSAPEPIQTPNAHQGHSI